jgi:hypothetical protein
MAEKSFQKFAAAAPRHSSAIHVVWSKTSPRSTITVVANTPHH